MDRYERQQLIKRLQAENAVMLTDNAIRKARHFAGNDPREWRVPESEPVHKQITGLIHKTHTNPPLLRATVNEEAMMTEEQRSEVVELVEALADEIGAKAGKAAREQDQAIARLEERLKTLEGLLMAKGLNIIGLRGRDAA